MDVDGSNVTRLTDDFAVDVTPASSLDGSRIAFASNRGGSFDVHVVKADGTDLTRITDDQAIDKNPAWSPLP